MNKPVLMIHEVSDFMFSLPLENYTLTFDDGLYTQYLHFDKIKKLNTDKIFFISTGIVADDDTKQSEEFIECAEAHGKLLQTGDLKHYMNWKQIHEIAGDPQCEIGGHSHMHVKQSIFNMVNDTNLMMDEFKKQFNTPPTKFCFPYNKSTPVYRALLSHYGFTDFYGSERVDIYELY